MMPAAVYPNCARIALYEIPISMPRRTPRLPMVIRPSSQQRFMEPRFREDRVMLFNPRHGLPRESIAVPDTHVIIITAFAQARGSHPCAEDARIDRLLAAGAF